MERVDQVDKISWSTGLPGFSMKNTWVSGDGYWEGSFTETNGINYGPTILVSGSDPYGWGGC